MIESMLERIRELWARLRPDPAKTSLGWWMVAIHVAIVLLVGGGISYSAIRMLHDLADEQGKSRVQLAGAMAREDLRRSAEDALTSARALAERPTLQRLLAEGRTDAIGPATAPFMRSRRRRRVRSIHRHTTHRTKRPRHSTGTASSPRVPNRAQHFCRCPRMCAYPCSVRTRTSVTSKARASSWCGC